MRKILFRGKRIDNGEWVYGSLFIQNGEWISKGDKTPDEYWIYGKQGEQYLVITSSVGQDTGMTDANGNKIFEWDILYSDICKSKVVVFDEESAAFCLYDKSIVSPQYLGRYNTEHFEIIGNIYDNPELLEKHHD